MFMTWNKFWLYFSLLLETSQLLCKRIKKDHLYTLLLNFILSDVIKWPTGRNATFYLCYVYSPLCLSFFFFLSVKGTLNRIILNLWYVIKQTFFHECSIRLKCIVTSAKRESIYDFFPEVIFLFLS